jgi:AcrR family transcriptional regulator
VAARKVFFDHGYERTSMAMIIKAAGISKTTLYARYANKEDLFRATLAYTLDYIGNKRLTSERDTDDLQLGLERYGYGSVGVGLSALWLSYERLVYAEGVRFPELIEGMVGRIDLVIGHVEAFIAECAERDQVLCRDPYGIAKIYIMAIRGFYTAAVLSAKVPGEDELKAYIDSLVATLMASRASW